jgi:hypothetical protein
VPFLIFQRRYAEVRESAEVCLAPCEKVPGFSKLIAEVNRQATRRTLANSKASSFLDFLK